MASMPSLVDGSMVTKFNSKDDALSFYKDIYGVNKTLRCNRLYSGANQVMYTCKDCSNFKLIVTRKKKDGVGTWWSLAKTASLEHASDSPNGKIPCLGQSTITSKDIIKDPTLRPLLNQSIPISILKSVIEAKGVRVTGDIIKKASAQSKISGEDHAASFNKIEPYLSELQKLNPGLCFKLDRVNDGVFFQRLIIVPHYTQSILQYIYPVLGLDSAHMKTIVISNASQGMSRTLLEKLFVTVLTTKLPGELYNT